MAVLFILERYTYREAALVSLVRILVIGFMFGNLFSIAYSLAGAVLSLTVMTLLKKKGGFQSHWNQYCRWCYAQCRPAHCCYGYCGKYQSAFLCTCAFDLGSDHRPDYRRFDCRNIKENPLTGLEPTGNSFSNIFRYNIFASAPLPEFLCYCQKSKTDNFSPYQRFSQHQEQEQ